MRLVVCINILFLEKDMLFIYVLIWIIVCLSVVKICWLK